MYTKADVLKYYIIINWGKAFQLRLCFGVASLVFPIKK